MIESRRNPSAYVSLFFPNIGVENVPCSYEERWQYPRKFGGDVIFLSTIIKEGKSSIPFVRISHVCKFFKALYKFSLINGTVLIRDLVFRNNPSSALIVVTINKIPQLQHKNQIKIEKMLWKRLLVDDYCLLSFCCLFSSLGSCFWIFIQMHSF